MLSAGTKLGPYEILGQIGAGGMGEVVYVAPFPGPGGKWQVSTAGGTFPKWRPDGKEIFFVGADGKLMAAPITDRGTSIEVGEVSPDGQRFLVNMAPPDPVIATPITVVVNWTAGLRK
jgi:hypothetical protein